MYRGRLWTMRQFAGFATPEDTNERFHFLLKQGQTGLSTAFDMPTLMGYDADHPRALGEVGREGVAVSSLVDMRALFQGVRLDRVTTSMTVNCSASALLAMYLAVAEEQGVPWTQVGGTIQNDMLKEFIAQKEWICPPEPSLRIVVDMIEFCARQVPRRHPRRRAVAAHELARRDARAALRAGGHGGAAHAADPGRGERDRERHRPARRQLGDRSADGPHGARGPRVYQAN